MIKNDLSNYNTYKIEGIPNHPICAVEFNSIKAAIFPKNTKYLYFMKNVDGQSHIFTTTYNEHKKAIKKVKIIKKATHLNKKKEKNHKKRKRISIKDLWK
jgi:cell division protein YceG involved in septum cleavage